MSSSKQAKKAIQIQDNQKTTKVAAGNNEIYVINEEDHEEHEAIMQQIEETLGDTVNLKDKLKGNKNNEYNENKNTQQSNVKSANFQKGQMGMLKDKDEKSQKQIESLKSQIDKFQESLNKAKAEQNKCQKQLTVYQDLSNNLQTTLDKKEDQIKQQQDKINILNNRNKDLEKISVEVRREQESLHKEKLAMETIKDKLNIQITDLNSRCNILKNENKNVTDVMVEKNKQSNEKIKEHLEKIQELSSQIADLKQEMKDYEVRYTKEKSAKDEFRIQLKMQEVAVKENEELKKKLAKKEDQLEELEDLVDKLKTKLRKFDTSLTVKDQYGQIKEYRSEKYSELLDSRQADQIKALQTELSQLTQSMSDFRNNNYKTECEKESLKVENASLREEVKRLERLKVKDLNEYESEVRDKLRTLENQRLKINTLQEQNSDLERAKVVKLELLRDSEFQKMELELTQSKNKIQQLENQNQQLQYKIDHLEQITNKKQLIMGDMHFQIETLKEEVGYLTNLKANNYQAKLTRNRPFKNLGSNALIAQPIIQEQQRKENIMINEQISPRYSLIETHQQNQEQQQKQYQQSAKHVYEMSQEMQGSMLMSPSHFEKDNYANFYRDTRQMMDSLNRYQSTSTVASQNHHSYY